MTNRRRHGGRRVARPGDRESAGVKLMLLAMILLCVTGVAALTAYAGVHESVLRFALPSYRLLADARRAAPADLPAAPPQAALSVSRVEAVHQSVEALAPAADAEPQILIYHTHATEAYLKTDAAPYVESGKWRSDDPAHSVIAVGALLAETLREEHGLFVLHDTTNHEPPKLSTAYSRSLDTMLRYQKRYPSLRVYIDVHRDAYGTADVQDGEPQDFVELDGREAARLMCVVGTGRGATGAGFDALPDFDANFAFASAVTEALNEINTGLTREIRVKSGRYNQHVSSSCLLVEVGHNANTLEQALASVPYLASAIARVMNEHTIEAASNSARDVWAPH